VLRRSISPILAPVVLVAVPTAALIALRPTPAGRPASWSGDDVVRVGCWSLACVFTAWLAITMLASVVAFVRGDALAAFRAVGGAPPVVRRLLQTVFAGAVAVAPMTSDTAPPVRLHAGADGRLVQGRARVASTTTSAATSTATRATSTTRPAPVPPASVPPPKPAAPPSRAPSPTRRSAPVSAGRVHVVRRGDNLWSIARAEVARATGDAHPSDSIIAAYWQRVIALNRATLRSGHPSLIFPGEIVSLPNP
jgi:nucleoid-associated protein YgaU